ncbi:hypothetical protein AC1031_001723 [Aphanomyces cochlioides]|nr:hypothetical protein AC1031_001723 [Aphanomyces cochlioides]
MPVSTSSMSIVFDRSGLFNEITAFMPGKAFKDWTDSYSILRAGHNPKTSAAAEGHLDVVEFLLAQQTDSQSSSNALAYAAASGHLHIVESLMQQSKNTEARQELSSEALAIAADFQQHYVVEWLQGEKNAPNPPSKTSNCLYSIQTTFVPAPAGSSKLSWFGHLRQYFSSIVEMVLKLNVVKNTVNK